MKALALLAALTALALAGAQPAAAYDVVPHDGDAFAKLVARAEARDATVDFKAMRFAWLDSAARKRERGGREMTEALWAAAKANDDAGVRAAAEKIIASHYTDIEAHKFRRQACAHLNDTVCGDHEHFIEFGLLNSIVKAGDGKTPATAWEVAEVAEEYAIMRLAGYQPRGQSLVNQNGRVYDRLDVTRDDGTAAVLWFDFTIGMTKEFPGLG